MNEYVFRFGYCTPAQWEANRKHGWDDECSGAFVVDADNSDRAYEWGLDVAEAYVRWQFERAGWNEIPSWKEAAFASWIDEDFTSEFSSELSALPRVKVGEIPTFEDWP